MRHPRAHGDELGGAGGVVLQGGDPVHYKLACTDEITMTDIVVKDVLLAHEPLTVNTCSVREGGTDAAVIKENLGGALSLLKREISK